MYTIHTTAKPDWHKFRNHTLAVTASGDCFYGWGEPASKRGKCIGHTTIQGVSLEEARRWAHVLVGDGYQVVVIDNATSEPVIDALTPIHYRAKHQH